MMRNVILAALAVSLTLQAFPASADPWGPRHDRYERHGPPGWGPPGWGAPWPAPYRPLPSVGYITVYPMVPPPPPGGRVVYVEPAPLQVIPASDPYLDGQGRYCREYQSTVMVGGMAQPAYGTACRMPDGTWRIVR